MAHHGWRPFNPGHVHRRLAERAAIPPAQRVVAWPVGIRPLGAVPAAARIDDTRIDLADILDIDSELAARWREIAGEEDIGIGGQTID